jgi:hypothetical protein
VLADPAGGRLTHAQMEDQLTELSRELVRLLHQDSLDLRAAREERREPVTGSDPSWASLVRKPIGAVDRIEGSAQVVGDRIGCRDDVRPGLDLDCAVTAGGLDELAD